MNASVFFRFVIMLIVGAVSAFSAPVNAQSVSTQVVDSGVVKTSPVVLAATTPEVIMTAFSTGDTLQFVELYNQSSAAIDSATITITTIDTLGIEQVIALGGGHILPKHFVTFSDNPSVIVGSTIFSTPQVASAADIVSITIVRSGSTTQTVNVPISAGNVNTKDDYLWAQHKQRTNTTIKQTGDFATDFTKKVTAVDLYSSPLYHAPLDALGLQLYEINPNPGDCSPEVLPQFSLVCRDYIKIVNTSTAAINLTQFRLRAGAFGDSVSITNSYNWQQSTFTPDDEYLLGPQEYIIIHMRDDLKDIALTASDKYVWLEDYYGVRIYESVGYPDMTLSAYNGKSWGKNTLLSSWGPAVPSPYSFDNTFVVEEEPEEPVVVEDILKPCGENQYRSTETNRCRSIVVSAALQPCKDGQYRSEETNRCRSIVQAVAASLKPCGDDQFRNPETGRCKKIASTEDIIAPCNDGWARNPETNRCRKILAVSDTKAPFAVEPVATESSTMVAIVTVAAVVASGMIYAGWEWRAELGAGIKRLIDIVTTFRK